MNNAARNLTVLAVAISSSLASAQPSAGELIDQAEVDAAKREESNQPKRRRHGRMALEALAIQAIGTAWYWRNTGDGFGESNVVDWQLGFKGDSLGKKLELGSDGWRFDGNSFALNAICHPAFGALTYWSARKNNYGVAESFLISTLVSGSWELLTEWAEYGSINDALSTSTTGVPLGEAAFQLMHNWRRARYVMQVGAGAQAGEGFVSLGGGVSLDTTPTTGDGMVVGGNKVNVAIEVPFDNGVRAVEGGVKTSLVGYYKNGASYKLFAGASGEFYYRDQKQRDSRDWDYLATIAVGPTVDLQVRRGDMTVDLGADLYADFGMLKAVAFDSWREQNPMETVRNSMQDKEKPYYYARGFTAVPRINLAYRGVNVGGKLALSKYDSLDGADRDQEMMTADPHIVDVDVSAQAWVGYTHKSVTVAVDGRMHSRTGTMDGARGDASERTTLLTVGYQR
ncbi:MAG: DUF3943 domain-containing protein [Myxococcota bacterium]|nr:DUF3943 domain-containing protein [Deltaproteobacteria bacterium]MDQ3340329.1 DUF3943 domain-containing protein [Myxococcota bacterium]